MKLYNSLTRTTEEFQPIDPAHVRMYVCGPTVYDRAHVGNGRPVVVFDTLFRLLKSHYGEDNVTYARNITDIDDKIIEAAAANGETIENLTKRTTAIYHADMGALNALSPTVEPRATAHVHDMIEMIEDLISSGNAYQVEGHVLFSVATSADYGKLSGRSIDEQIAGARVEVAPYKRDPVDFVLWKPSPEDWPGWESPWGRGRPSWHIECSAMSGQHLGDKFDIHGGGIDLIFPHHENEIAQSTCANGVAPARVWMHNGHVVVSGQKMSKSLGNFTTVEQLLQRYPGEVIRVALLSAHYRQPLDITDDLLAQSKARLDYLYGVLRRNPPSAFAKASADKSPAGFGAASPGNGKITEALDDDLNTPQALAALTELGRQVEAGTESGDALLDQAQLLGLLQADPADWFQWEPPHAAGLTPEAIDQMIAQRNKARENRDFAEADRLRNALLAEGVVLEDTAAGTSWRRQNI